uniref:Centromere protein Cenp-F N-terminal domain-containing protein n=1 Tax=Cyclopterus lumpus TaxID=8103 RepID=A0A8C2XNE9_CYCLU
MSWAEEDWTVGLSGRVLQKVKELQVHQERLSRENKQKQLQLDNIHTGVEKQNVKVQADAARTLNSKLTLEIKRLGPVKWHS